MWDSIARTLSVDRHLDPWSQARLLALLNITLADGYIAVLAEKYDYLFWRPVTAIRLADQDGNPATTADPILDAARDHSRHPRPPVRTLDRGRRRGRCLPDVLRHRPDALHRLQHDGDDRRRNLRLRPPGRPPLQLVLPGGVRERGVPDPDRVPLPVRHPGGHQRRAVDGPLDRLALACGRRAEGRADLWIRAPGMCTPGARSRVVQTVYGLSGQ